MISFTHLNQHSGIAWPAIIIIVWETSFWGKKLHQLQHEDKSGNRSSKQDDNRDKKNRVWSNNGVLTVSHILCIYNNPWMFFTDCVWCVVGTAIPQEPDSDHHVHVQKHLNQCPQQWAHKNHLYDDCEEVKACLCSRWQACIFSRKVDLYGSMRRPLIKSRQVWDVRKG